MTFNPNELRILWYLKRNGPLVRDPHKRPGIPTELAESLRMGISGLKGNLLSLERQDVILRTYLKGGPKGFGSMHGNPMIRLELVDPNMKLPPEPKPVPTVVVDARENEELFQMTKVEPSPDAVILALLHRNEELQGQVDKLANVIVQQQEQIRVLSSQKERVVPEHLTSRVKDALTPEQWENISHSAKR